jgi:transcription elongation factor GreB
LLYWGVAGPNYLTPDGAEKLRLELTQLLNVERPKVVSDVADAAAMGDRSENAEYIYGKKRLREIDRKIRSLTKRLEDAVVVDPSKVAHGEVRFGATVTLVDEDGNEKKYMLVGPDESDPDKGHLSFQSPIGKALMKRKVGDFVLVKRPAGEVEFEITAITYE